MTNARHDARVASLLAEVGVSTTDRAAIADEVVGGDPVYATPFPVGECAAVALTASAVVAGTLFAERTGRDQSVTTEVARAAAWLLDFVFATVTDGTGPVLEDRRRPLVNLYRGRDGRWIHLHGAFPALAEGTTSVLGCPTNPGFDEVAAAVARVDAFDLEDRLAEARMCGAAVRTSDEWGAHPQGRAVRRMARVEIEKIGESAPEPAGAGDRPLGGLRVLDLTRVLAGPTNASMLAAHGADVLLLNGPTLPNVDAFLLSTSAGKRSALVDLDDPDGAGRLRDLIRDADVFSQCYRSGALGARGFGPDEVASLRPGVVYVTINCYGDAGPWRSRPGWEQLAQSASGLAAEQGGVDAPALIPAAACDYTTGFLASLGTMAALLRRSREGGSYHVRASLGQTAWWFDREHRVDPTAATGIHPSDDWFEERATPWGPVRRLRPPVTMSATPMGWERVSRPPGTDPAGWPARSPAG